MRTEEHQLCGANQGQEADQQLATEGQTEMQNNNP